MITGLPIYRDRGARALVLLQEQQLPLFVATWRRAQKAGVRLPQTDDPHYASLEALLAHVLRSARGYTTWICEHLDLPDPEIPPAPAPDAVEAQADAWLAEMLERWRTPLSDVTPERLRDGTYLSRWGQRYTIGAMLEHAVVHPMRHRLQLDELLEQQA